MFPTNLPPGSSGAAVHLLQLCLISRGFNCFKPVDRRIIADGKYGDITTTAVKELQGSFGLELTGVLDEATVAALKANLGLDLAVLVAEDFINETLLPPPATQQTLAGVAN